MTAASQTLSRCVSCRKKKRKKKYQEKESVVLPDETGSRSDADKTCDCALASTDDGEATLVLDHVHHDPANGTGRGGRVGVEGGVHGTHGTVQCRSTVESEPAEPDEAGAEENKRGVVRLAVHGLLATLGPPAENEGVGKRGPARGNVHGTTTGIVERRKVVQPSVAVPGPAGNGAVHDCAPAEAEDEGRNDAATLKGATNDNLDRAGREEEFVETEDNLREHVGAGRWGSRHILHAEVGKVADECVGCAREGQRVSPKHPLKCCSVEKVRVSRGWIWDAES